MNVEIVKLREVVTKLVPLLTGKGLQVTQRGTQAYVDIDPATRRPRSVNIPNIPDTATPDFVRAINGFIDHEVGHVLKSDYDIFGAGIRSKADEEDPRKATFHHIHNLVEDTFIEREIVKDFPGSRRNLTDLHEHFLRKVTAPALASAKSQQEEFSYLTVVMVRALAGQEVFQEFMDDGKHWDHPMVKELLSKLDQPTLDLFKNAKSSWDTHKVAQAMFDILFNPPPEQEGGGSEDKPDKEAGPGNGKGKRKHSKSNLEPAEESEGEGSQGESSESEADGKSGKSGKSKGDKDQEDEDEGEGSGKGDKNEGEDESEAKGEDKSEDQSDDEGEDKSEDKSKDQSDDEGDDEGKDDSEDEPDEKDVEVGNADATFTSTFSSNDGDKEGSGVGSSDTSSSMFDLQDDMFKGRDIGSEISGEISKTAETLMTKRSTWTAFTREFDQIEPLQPGHVNAKWVPEMEEKTALLTARMQKDIERLLASTNWVVQTPGHRKGKLHAPSLYKMKVGNNEDRVFKQRQEHKSVNTAVTLLVDNSGSMHGSKCTLAMVSAYALSQTLERVKVNHEVIGFTTGHYSYSGELNDALMKEHTMARSTGVHFDRTVPLVMPLYKQFGERINSEVKRRFAFTMNAQAGLNGNIDGESLQIAAERLMRQPEKRKVILVLSDGQPAGGVNSGPHLKHVVSDLNKNGIETIGIGILDDSVRLYYDKHVVLRDVNDLPVQVMSELRKILTA